MMSNKKIFKDNLFLFLQTNIKNGEYQLIPLILSLVSIESFYVLTFVNYFFLLFNITKFSIPEELKAVRSAAAEKDNDR